MEVGFGSWNAVSRSVRKRRRTIRAAPLLGIDIDREIEEVGNDGIALPSRGSRPVCSTLTPSTIRMSGRSTSIHWFGMMS
jgi:hypothetical protein